MTEFKLVTWNIMGKRPLNSRLLKRVAGYFERHQADILCLQENPQGKRFINRTVLKDYFVLTTKKTRNFLYSGNSIVSKFPIVHSGEISFLKNGDKRKRGILNATDRHDCLWADIDIEGTLLRVYNCHLKIIAATARDRLRAIERVYQHARDVVGPVIVCGDMNTVLSHPKGVTRKLIRWFNDIEETYLQGKLHITDERLAFGNHASMHNFHDILSINTPTFAVPYTSIELFKLKLDWVLIRSLTHVSHTYGPYISDHRPIHATFQV